ncbi:MAG TPA: competence/damage-inducible protein A [Gemmatimonadaceae bacterium]|nr:competence/damage-inducible protein A [Gemmatimonadaceae bacterium]
MRVELVTIGNELLLGLTTDTNASHLARELASAGLEVVRHATVGDDDAAIAAAVGEAIARTGLVITTGGLGPTDDDVTRTAVAGYFGRPLGLDDAILGALHDRWRRFGRPGELPASNRVQALVPEGAVILENRYGSAPGLWIEDEAGRVAVLLPGVPREMRGLLADEVLPRLRARLGAAVRVVRSHVVRTTDIAESAVADRIASLAPGTLALPLAYLPGPDGVDLRLTAPAMPPAEADALLARDAAVLRDLLHPHVYGADDDDLAAVVNALCRERGLRIATAESCTGGLLGARITAIPGSSDVMEGGVVAYQDRVKQGWLHVRAETLREHGAVSEPVARAMASGARQRFDTAVGVGITGVAGPGGGTPKKPVGTVWVAVDVSGAMQVRRWIFGGDRAEIRWRATQGALEMIRRALTF